ncbi:MAG: sugar ABC transporter permease [Spirochaetales bacterium]|nr:sugar ABC transporter permease [Spirochaetales bacterium]
MKPPKVLRAEPLLKEIRRNRVAYAYIAPFYILFAIFGLFPIVSGFLISFFRWDGLSPMKFTAFRNYVSLFQDPLFWKSLGNTFYVGLIAHVFILLGGLVLAYILNTKLIKYPNIFKTIYFLPMVTSAVATGIVFKAMFGMNAGIINLFISSLGFGKIDWWGGTGAYIKPAIIIMFSWKWIGWNMVIYLAGMQGISTDIYEAATIDGANHIQVFFRITIPLLRPIILFTLIQSTIGTLNLFTEPFILLGGGSLLGGTGNQGMTVMMYLLNKAPYGNNHYGYASATAYVMCSIIIIASLINMKITERREGK